MIDLKGTLSDSQSILLRFIVTWAYFEFEYQSTLAFILYALSDRMIDFLPVLKVPLKCKLSGCIQKISLGCIFIFNIVHVLNKFENKNKKFKLPLTFIPFLETKLPNK